jgi:hypothetical protein
MEATTVGASAGGPIGAAIGGAIDIFGALFGFGLFGGNSRPPNVGPLLDSMPSPVRVDSPLGADIDPGLLILPALQAGHDGKTSTSGRRSWACSLDSALNFGLGFIPLYNAVRVGGSVLGVNFHPFETIEARTASVVTIGPTTPQAAAGVASGYQWYRSTVYEQAGGLRELRKLQDLKDRIGFGAKTLEAQVEISVKLEGMAKLAKGASSAGTVANLLNLASFGYDVWGCWHPKGQN